MSGPIKNARSPGERAEWWERWGLGAGLVVVIGLLIESGPDLAHSIIRHEWPSRATIGNLIVVLGVGGEVIFSWRAVRAAREAELDAARDIAATNERAARALDRAAKAEKDAAEANLARVRIENKFKVRKLSEAAYSDLQEALKRYSGVRIDVLAFGYSQLSEVMPFAFELTTACKRAGCDSKLWEAGPSMKPPLVMTGSVLIATARESTPQENDVFIPIANIIASALARSGVKFSFEPQSFSDTDAIVPNPAPTFLPWNPNDVARFRIQLIELSLLDSRFAP